ncbi:c-type cytochrome [Geopsychrobacter electrodiphilus]|uniref:c-type cytochrome n=1 Tax=Geopsychrobacter electrodiphilus TaxID=225196 RepID=UPI000362BCF8|nr:cytochrome c [Geopsychrobacter electrodiphilus]
MRPILVAITLLLSTLTSPLLAADLTSEQSAQARQLFTALGCQACHDFNKSGSTLAPSLDRIGLKLNAEQILARLQLPAQKLGQGEKFMPSYRTTAPAQLELLSRFLAQRK